MLGITMHLHNLTCNYVTFMWCKEQGWIQCAVMPILLAVHKSSVVEMYCSFMVTRHRNFTDNLMEVGGSTVDNGSIA